MTESSSLISTCRDHFINKLAGTAADELSKAFAVVNFILMEAHACAFYVGKYDVDWPYRFTYQGEIQAYKWLNRILEVSVLAENNLGQKCYYICINFPERQHTYHVEEIGTVPIFKENKREMDELSIHRLCKSISLVFDSFCRKFVKLEKIPLKEYSLAGLEPLFFDKESDSGKQPTKKRKNISTLSPYDMTKFKLPVPVFYTRLCDLFRKMNPKPNAPSRLFSLIHEILTFFYGCKTTVKIDEWPTGPEYDSNVIQVWIPDSQNELSNIEYHLFNFSVMKNEKEFFCSFRFLTDRAKKCVKKLNQLLVPSFDPAESEKDMQCIDNLHAWVSTMIEKFIQRVIAGSYTSEDVSFVSLASSTSSPNVLSSDEDVESG